MEKYNTFPYTRKPKSKKVARKLFAAQDLESQCHTFRNKVYKRPKNCQVCRQLIWNQGSACRVCRYACHKRCESQVMSTCVPPVNYELKSTETLNKQGQTAPSPPPRGIISGLKTKMARSKEEGPWELDVTYITERMIAMSFPEEGTDIAYRNSLRDVTQMLRSKHGDNFLIINISERHEELHRLCQNVLDFGWPERLAPPLERLCSICKSIDSWLNSDPNHVTVIHCKGARGRSGVVIAAYMHYSNICARKRRKSSKSRKSADQDLDRFAMKRFYDDKLGGVTQPSQRRYVHYFAGLLSGAIKINSKPLYLHQMIIHGVPNYDGRGGCRPFIKVYQAMHPIFTSPIYTVTAGTPGVCITLRPSLQLRGDIFIKCYHKRFRSAVRDTIFRCQFHTCAISNFNITFTKHELDDACSDPRFPELSRVEFVFAPSQDNSSSSELFQEAPLAADDSSDALVRWDSYENFINNDQPLTDVTNGNRGEEIAMSTFHTSSGPVDGNIYSRVHKSSTSSTSRREASSATSSHQTAINGSRSINGPYSRDSGISSASSHHVGAGSRSQDMALTTKFNHKQNLDDQSQLDEIISELLGDQMFSTSPTTPPRSSSKNLNLPPSGTITTSSGNTRTILSWESSQAGPKKSTAISKQSKTVAPNLQSESSASFKKEFSQQGDPNLGFSYSSSSQSHNQQYSSSSNYYSSGGRHESIMSPLGSPPPARLYSVPWKVDTAYDNQDLSASMDYSSDSELSWLQQQQMKLRAKREGKERYNRTEQEKRLVSELKSAQNVFTQKKSISEAEEAAFLDKYASDMITNGPSTNTYQRSPSPEKPPPRPKTPESYRTRSEHTVYRSKTPEPYKPPRYPDSYRTKTPEPYRSRTVVESYRSKTPDPMKKESQYKQESFVFRTTSPKPTRREFSTPQPLRRTLSHQEGSHSEKTYFVSGLERPPFTTHQTKYVFSVSPPKYSQGGSGKASSGSSPGSPSVPPRGNSSQDAVMRSRSLSRDYYGPRLPRQHSESSFDRYYDRYGQFGSYDSDLEQEYPGYASSTLPSLIPQSTTSTLNRTTLESTRKASIPKARTDEIDRSIAETSFQSYSYEKAAAPPPPMPPPPPPPPPPPKIEEPEPEPEEIIEEEVISLRPVGKGMHVLEPERPPDGGRMTPGFPTGGVGSVATTPPFPTSSRIPYATQVYSQGGSSYSSSSVHTEVVTFVTSVGQRSSDSGQSSDPLYASIDETKMTTGPKVIQQTQYHQQSVSNVQQSYSSTGGPPGMQPGVQPVMQPQLQGPSQQVPAIMPPPGMQLQSPPQMNGQMGHDMGTLQSGSTGTLQSGASMSGTGTLQSGSTLQGGTMHSGMQPSPVQGMHPIPMQSGIPVGMQTGTMQGCGTLQGGMQGGTLQSGMQGGTLQSGMHTGTLQSGMQGGTLQGGMQGGTLQGGMQGGTLQGGMQGGTLQSGMHTGTMQTGTLQSGMQGNNMAMAMQQPPMQQPPVMQQPPMMQLQGQAGNNNMASSYSTVHHSAGQQPLQGGGMSQYEMDKKVQSHQSYNVSQGPPSAPSQTVTQQYQQHQQQQYNYSSSSGTNQRPIMSTAVQGGPLNAHQQALQYNIDSPDAVRGQQQAGFQQTGFQQTGGIGIQQGMAGMHTQSGQQRSAVNGGSPPHQALHVDTSQRMLAANMHSTSSAGSQISPDTSTLRSQQSTMTQQSGMTTPNAMSTMTGQSSPYFGQSHHGSFSSLDSMEISSHTPKFVRDTSKYWYKSHISREEAISFLKDKEPGTFIVRDSNSFPGAFGLALKVAHVPPNVSMKPGDPPGSELVRHFLIETTPKGVKLRGCSNEPVFGSLAALVYQHSITPLALPCKLKLPESDSVDSAPMPSSAAQLLSQGAACNVVYLSSVDTESLTGPEAVAKAVKDTFANNALKTTVVHFKVSSQGITLTDTKRRLFFRRHYAVNTVTYSGMDPEDRRWSRPNDDTGIPMNAKVFGFVARKQGGSADNACHLFAELDVEQPATAIVNFINKVMLTQGRSAKS